MRPFLPTDFPSLTIPAVLFAGILFGGLGRAQDEDTTVVFKQLVFIEQQEIDDFASVGVEDPYDVVVSPGGEHVYVALQKYNNSGIAWFTRDAEEGTLTYAGSADKSDFGENVLSGLRSLVFSPDGKYLYGVTQFSNSLLSFERNLSTGQLTLQDTLYDGIAGVDGLDGSWALALSPDGKNIYVAAADDDKVSVFSRNATNGAVSFQGVYEEGDQGVEELTEPAEIIVSPDGKHLYVALYSNQIISFDRDDTNGLLTYQDKLSYLTGDAPKIDSPRAFAFSADGGYLYVASANNDALSAFSRDAETGALTHLDDYKDGADGISDLDGPYDLVISSDGDYLYVASYTDDAIVCFERDSETGLLSFSQSIHAEEGDAWNLNGPRSIGASPDGEHVYMGTVATPDSLSVFRRDVLEDPPVLVVKPVSKSIEEGETVAFHALGEGVELSYQWIKNGAEVSGATSPVLTLASASSADDGSLFQIKISNPGGYVLSEEVSLEVLPPVVVNAPVDLTALNVSSNSAQLQWSDRSDNETSFEVQRRLTGESFETIATVLANEIQYGDTTIAASTNYRYRVRAKRNDNASLWSNDAVVESLDDVPQPPVNLVVTEQSYNRVGLRWSDRSAVEDGFRVLRREDSIGSDWQVIGFGDRDATTYSDRMAAANTTYAYRVQAYNESGYSDFTNSVVAITSDIPVSGIDPISREVESIAKSGYGIAVQSIEDWEAISNVSWIVVTSPVGGLGTGNEQVSYRVSLNESQDERMGKVVVGGIEHTVIQAGSDAFTEFVSDTSEISAAGGTTRIDIRSNEDWIATENSDWLEITSGASGNGYGTVVLRAAVNDSFDARNASVTVNGKEHVITQLGKVPYMRIDSLDNTFTALGGDGELQIESNVAWTADVSEPWISLTSVSEGEGDGSLSFSVQANPGEARNGYIEVNLTRFTITQEAPGTVISDVAPPTNLEVSVDSLGAQLAWQDNSDDELGFRIRRTVVGSDYFVEVARVDANVSSYRDNDAPRGVAVEYWLSSFDAIGFSEEITATSEVLPTSRIVSIATRAHAGTAGELIYVRMPVEGDGLWLSRTQGFGEWFETARFGQPFATTEFNYNTHQASREVIGAGTEQVAQSETDLWAEIGQSPSGMGISLAGWAGSEGQAYSNGASVRSVISTDLGKVAVAFEISGSEQLPILIQALGPTLAAMDASEVLANPQVMLFEIDPGTGAKTLLAENNSWKSWTDDAAVSLADANEATGALALDSAGVEAAMLLMLGEGRYLAVLTGEAGDEGACVLEVLDAR